MDGQLREKHLAFADFIARYGRSYASKTEVDTRFEIFANNFDDIKAHNEQFEAGKTLFQKGVNKFSDLTKDEFNARYHSAMLGTPTPKKSFRPHVFQSNKLTSAFWDWINPWSKKDDDVDEEEPAPY